MTRCVCCLWRKNSVSEQDDRSEHHGKRGIVVSAFLRVLCVLCVKAFEFAVRRAPKRRAGWDARLRSRLLGAVVPAALSQPTEPPILKVQIGTLNGLLDSILEYWGCSTALVKYKLILRGLRSHGIEKRSKSYSTTAILLASDSGIHKRPLASRAMFLTEELGAGMGYVRKDSTEGSKRTS